MNQRTGVVVLLEGSEQCGKTTLANKIHDRFKADYLHGDRPDYNTFKQFHFNMCQAAVMMAADGHVVVLDRCFISHEVYNTLFDGKPEYDTHKLCEEMLTHLTNDGSKLLLVYCRPERKFDPNMREEMYDDSDGKIQNEFDRVISSFAQDLPNFIRYDYNDDPSGESVLKFIEELHNGQ